MGNFEKAIAEEILKAFGADPSHLGLRFDRVAARMLGDLRAFSDSAVPEGLAIVVTVSAPIRRPAKTTEALRRMIEDLLEAGGAAHDRSGAVHDNAVAIRLVRRRSQPRPKFVGFVHNRGDAARPLADLAERWLDA